MSNYDPESQQKAQAAAAASGKHATKLQRWARILDVQKFIAIGATHGEIVKHLVTEYGLSRAMAYRYVARAEADWTRFLRAQPRERILARQDAKLNHLIAKAYARVKGIWVDGVRVGQEPDPDLSVVATALATQNRLHGLDKPDEIEVAEKYLREPMTRVAAALKALVASLAASKFVVDVSNERQLVAMLGTAMRDALRTAPTEEPLIQTDAQVLDSRKRLVASTETIIKGL